MSRLTSDRSISQLVAQFVPLKIDTSGEDWQTWARKYRHQGGALPILYVVRADGEMLYGRGGSLEDAALPQLLVESLKNSGRIFSNREMATLRDAVSKANEARTAGNMFEAVIAISAIKKLGELGELNSHARIAIEADLLVGELGEAGVMALQEAEKMLARENNPFAGALALVDAERNYSKLPALKVELTQAMRKYKKETSLREIFRQAETFVRAREQARSKRTARAGLASLQKFIVRYPDTPAAEMAIAEYRSLTGNDPTVNAAAPNSPSGDDPEPRELRVWMDVSGKFQIKARLVEIEGAVVTLKKEDGSLVEVPLDKLSKQDRQYCDEHAKADLK